MISNPRLALSVLATALTLSAAAWSPAARACAGTEPLLGSVCIFAGNFAPNGFAFTNGQLLPIAQDTALFSILGTTYGGNGTSNFALPDTRGRVIVGFGQGPGLSNYNLGQMGGTENVTLTIGQMPQHNHTATTSVVVTARGVSTSGNADGPGGNAWAAKARAGNYSTSAPDVDMAAGAVVVSSASTTVGLTGGNQPFSIVQPYVVLNPIIALVGVFPSRN